MPTSYGFVVFDAILAAQRVHDGCLQRTGGGDEAGRAPRHKPCPGQDGHPVGAVRQVGRCSQFLVAGADPPAWWAGSRPAATPGRPRGAGCQPGTTRTATPRFSIAVRWRCAAPAGMCGRTDQFAVHAAFPEQFMRVGLLDVAAADLLARDVRGDRENRYPAVVRVEQPGHQMQVARPADGGADGRSPVTAVSPAAANAAASSCLTCSLDSVPSRRRCPVQPSIARDAPPLLGLAR